MINIYNACLSAGYFPTIFKKAIIKFIPKENKNHKNALNYRPISLLEVPGKIFEKLLLSRLDAYISDNNIIKDRQHGFRKLKGITAAIATAYEKVSQNLAEGNQVFVVLRDVAKAFDKVWHAGLIYKLMHLGLPPRLEKILINFLHHRTAKISIGSELSNEIKLMS